MIINRFNISHPIHSLCHSFQWLGTLPPCEFCLTLLLLLCRTKLFLRLLLFHLLVRIGIFLELYVYGLIEGMQVTRCSVMIYHILVVFIQSGGLLELKHVPNFAYLFPQCQVFLLKKLDLSVAPIKFYLILRSHFYLPFL